MIPRRRLALALALGLGTLAWPLAGRAQRTAPVRLGYVWIGPPGSDKRRLQAIRQGLAEVGLVEGESLRIETRYADGQPARLKVLVQELLQLKVDILLAPGAAVTRVMREATSTVPIVSISGDPVVNGFAQSLARPGGNITGLTISVGVRIAEKWLELLKEIEPKLQRVAYLLELGGGGANTGDVLRQAGQRLGIEVVMVPFEKSADVLAALATVERSAVGGIVFGNGTLAASQSAQLVALAAKLRIPAVYGQRDHVEAGGLISYDASLYDIWRRTGAYVDKILKGAKPAELAIEQPSRFELVVNLKTAHALGIKIPQLILLRADEVIE